jgi:hypothetical protein
LTTRKLAIRKLGDRGMVVALMGVRPKIKAIKHELYRKKEKGAHL